MQVELDDRRDSGGLISEAGRTTSTTGVTGVTDTAMATGAGVGAGAGVGVGAEVGPALVLDDPRVPIQSAALEAPEAAEVLSTPSASAVPALSARGLTVTVKHRGVVKTLLDDVSFDVPEQALVAVIGPSGSGKSTLLRALTGSRPADIGGVRYAGHDLSAEYSLLRHRIGLVPQDDVLHAQLTVKSGLRYAADLRFPQGTTAEQREQRIDEVLTDLRLTEFENHKVAMLSGGQRKRVSVALELLTKPSVLFLDEPTSGLDPGMDRDVMRMLRGLADEGRTVLVATHSVAELEACDLLLVMAPGGGVAYYGPPREAMAFFECETWADVFHAFSCRKGYDWAGAYRSSAFHAKYSAEASAAAASAAASAAAPEAVCAAAPTTASTTAPTTASAAALPSQRSSSEDSGPSAPAPTAKATNASAPTTSCYSSPRAEQGWGSQLRTLMRRYVRVIAADRGHLMLLAALPMIMGVLSLAIPAASGLAAAAGGDRNTDAPTVLLVLAVGACLTGAANAVRELIKERGIYDRERAAGLSRSAYVMSKAIVLGVITATQTIVLSALCILPRRLPAHGMIISGSPVPELMIAAVLLGVISMLLGLVVSAVVRTTEKTMPLLVLITIVAVVFSGSLFPLFHSPALEELAWLSPSRWAVAAEASTINLPGIMGPPQGRTTTDPLWQHTIVQWFTDIGVLTALGVGFLALVLRLLRRHESSLLRGC